MIVGQFDNDEKGTVKEKGKGKEYANGGYSGDKGLGYLTHIIYVCE